MKASVVDMRYRMREVLAALERREQVTLLHRGKVKGVIVPAGGARTMRAEDHPLFGMSKDDPETVKEKMARLRKPRYSDIRH